jgi:hypothetical protein
VCRLVTRIANVMQRLAADLICAGGAGGVPAAHAHSGAAAAAAAAAARHSGRRVGIAYTAGASYFSICGRIVLYMWPHTAIYLS